MSAITDLPLETRDSRQIAVEFVSNVYQAGDKKVIQCNIRDITERKRVEEALRASRAKLDAALASMTDAVFISDTEGRFIEFNDAFATFHKFRSKAECAKTLAEYPAFLEVFMANGELVPLDQWAVPRALRGETATDAEFTLRRKDTGETWVGSYSFAPIRDKAGEIVGSVVLGRDVTERKEGENALRQSEGRLAAIIGSAMDGIIAVDKQQRITVFNAAAEKMFGYTASEMLGQPLDRLIPERFRLAHAGHIRKFEQTRVTHRSADALGTIFGLRASGEEFPIEASISQTTADEAKLFTVILRDVTERRLAEQLRSENLRLDESSRQIEAANRLKSEFLANMSHELPHAA